MPTRPLVLSTIRLSRSTLGCFRRAMMFVRCEREHPIACAKSAGVEWRSIHLARGCWRESLMTAHFPWEKIFVNAYVFRRKWRFIIIRRYNCGMGEKPSRKGKQPSLPPQPLWVGNWIDAIPGRTRKEAAARANIDESYISNMSDGKILKNPRAVTLRAISDYLGIKINDFYGPPPPPAVLRELLRFSPETREALLQSPTKKP